MLALVRGQVYLAYQVPKRDDDRSRLRMYLPRRKTELLYKVFPFQGARDWWDDVAFLGLARLRGIRRRAAYAEAFTLCN